MRKWLNGFVSVTACLAIHLTVSAQNDFLPSVSSYHCNSSFGGFYLGVHGGFIGYEAIANELPPAYFDAGAFTPTETYETLQAIDPSWEAGLQIGYDWIYDGRFFGLIADWAWSEAQAQLLKASTLFIMPLASPVPFTAEASRRMQWFSTFRARGGLNLVDSLVYITGGAAIAEFKTLISGGFSAAGFDTTPHHFHQHLWGWTVGLGMEHAFWQKLSVCIELLYLSFDTKKLSFSADFPDAANAFFFDFSDNGWVGRLGVNYHFAL